MLMSSASLVRSNLCCVERSIYVSGMILGLIAEDNKYQLIKNLVHATDVERPWLEDNGATPEISLFQAVSRL